MIISHRYRFIFIKTLKTAGTSIEVYLSEHCGPDDIFTPVFPPIDGHRPRNFGRFYNHYSAFGVRQAVGPELWGSYFKFCVERNPWDKVVSHYAMESHKAKNPISFDQYLTRKMFRECVNYPLYTDEDDETLLVDRILRFEQLNQDLSKLFEQLKVPWQGDLGVRAKSGYRNDQRPFQEFYSDAQRQLVEQAFQWECRHLGYTFDGKQM